MKPYIATKILTKSIMAVSFIAMLLTIGFAIKTKNKISADTNSFCQLATIPFSAISYPDRTSKTAYANIGVNMNGNILSYSITKKYDGQVEGSGINGTLGTGQSESEIPINFDRSGKYTVEIGYSDGFCSGIYSQIITIDSAACAANTYPDITGSISKTVVEPGGTFNLTVTNPSPTENYTVHIDFDKGSQYSPQELLHGSTKTFPFDVYSDAEGSYHVKVKAYSQSGCDAGFFNPIICISRTGSCSSTGTGDENNSGSGSEPYTPAPVHTGAIGDDKKPTNLETIDGLIDKLLPQLPEIIAVLAFAGIVVGGYMYLTAGANPTQAERGKKSLIYSIIGLVLAGLAYVIIKAIQQSLQSL